MPEFEPDQQEASNLYQLRDIDWSLHYQLIGEFIAEFEKITTELRFVYACILQANGLRMWKLAEFILYIETIGPGHLARSLCAAVKELFPNEASLLKKANAINKETQYIAEKRNEIAHGEWDIGPEVVIVTDKPDLPGKMGIKRKVSKDGMRVEELPAATDFRTIIQRTRVLVNEIKNLHSNIIVLNHSLEQAKT